MRLHGPEWSLFGETALRRDRFQVVVSMEFRSGLAAAVAVVLFAVAWPVCELLAGLGVGGSSAVAGILAIAVFGMTLWVTRPKLPPVGYLPPAHARPDRLTWPVDAQPRGVRAERDVLSGEGELLEEPTITGRSTPQARDTAGRERVRTLVTQDLQFIVDEAGMQIRRRRITVGGGAWEEHIRVQWSAVTAIGFAIDRHDSIVALYAWAAVRKPDHLADSRSLDTLQWTQLSELIAEATSGRLTLDVASRYNIRSIWPDW